MNRHRFAAACVPILIVNLALAPSRAEDFRDQAAGALRRAADYYRTEVATEGGFLWRYSEDLSHREGENVATASMVWVQPPGTPSVGQAFLDAYEATGEQVYLDAARGAALALVRGQLRSGGWDYLIEFDPEARRRYAYRVDPETPKARNVTTLDDNTTQSALRLLMHVDRDLKFDDPVIHEAALYGLASLVRVQYPNGAWPQRFERPPDPSRFPVRPARYPESWPRTFPGVDYRGFYTLNDNSLADAVSVMLDAARIYKDPTYRAAAERAGDFLRLARMPEPQPAWAQQYNAEMEPAWARKFEPPAITGGESQGAMKILLELARETGDPKYLEPIPDALAYLRRSRLPDGQLARFYELQTNRPLYFTKDYRLTDDDGDLPTHYGFKIGSGALFNIARDYDRLQARIKAGESLAVEESPPRLDGDVEQRARRAVEALDDRGRWLQDGPLSSRKEDEPGRILDSRTFVQNVGALARYLEASRP